MRNCSENVQQIYKRTPKQKHDFNKVALYLHGNHTTACVFSINFAAYFRTSFFKNTFERLLLIGLLLILQTSNETSAGEWETSEDE